jgi:hypothetical protein
MGNILPKLLQVIGIAYNSDPNDTHGRTITSFDAYQKGTEWFFHHMNGLVWSYSKGTLRAWTIWN